MSYTYTLYDTLYIQNGQVGIGSTAKPAVAFDVNGTLGASAITNAGCNLDFSHMLLSNIREMRTQRLSTSSIGTSEAYLDMTNSRLSNVREVSAGHVAAASIAASALTVASIAPSGAFVNFNGATLCNLGAVHTDRISFRDGTSFTSAGASGASTLSSATSNLSFAYNNLSNIDVLSANRVVTSTIVGAPSQYGTVIGFNGTMLQGISSVLAYSGLFQTTITNTIQANNGGAISFNDNNLYNIGNLTASNLTILGEHTILNTVTSNTDQLVIDNAGSDIALVVRQSGNYPAMEVYDNDTLALRVAHGGFIGIGTASPSTALHVEGTVTATSFASTSGALSFSSTSMSNIDVVSASHISAPNATLTRATMTTLTTSEITSPMGRVDFKNCAIDNVYMVAAKTAYLVSTNDNAPLTLVQNNMLTAFGSASNFAPAASSNVVGFEIILPYPTSKANPIRVHLTTVVADASANSTQAGVQCAEYLINPVNGSNLLTFNKTAAGATEFAQWGEQVWSEQDSESGMYRFFVTHVFTQDLPNNPGANVFSDIRLSTSHPNTPVMFIPYAVHHNVI